MPTKKPAKKQASFVTGVQDVYYNVEDMKRAVKFYRDVLGLTVKDTNDYWTSLDVGGVRVGLHGGDGHKVPRVPRDAHGAYAGATLTLGVNDIRGAVAHYKEARVKFLGEISFDEWGNTVAFEDSEGNVLKLMELPKK